MKNESSQKEKESAGATFKQLKWDKTVLDTLVSKFLFQWKCMALNLFH